MPTAVRVAEERRLFYVACTRARRRLVVTAVAGTEGEGDQPSRFLDELGVTPVARTGRPRRPLTLPALVGELRRTSVDPDAPAELREQAALRLARLADATDDAAIRTAQGPVLDVGCGPGRMLRAAALQGHLVLGIDVAPAAVRLARGQGLPVLLRSVFDRLPGMGRWGTALLMDGNIGIGGDPSALPVPSVRAIRRRERYAPYRVPERCRGRGRGQTERW